MRPTYTDMRNELEAGAMNNDELDESVSSVERETVATRDDIFDKIYMSVRNGIADAENFKASASHA